MQESFSDDFRAASRIVISGDAAWTETSIRLFPWNIGMRVVVDSTALLRVEVVPKISEGAKVQHFRIRHSSPFLCHDRRTTIEAMLADWPPDLPDAVALSHLNPVCLRCPSVHPQ